MTCSSYRPVEPKGNCQEKGGSTLSPSSRGLLSHSPNGTWLFHPGSAQEWQDGRLPVNPQRLTPTYFPVFC